MSGKMHVTIPSCSIHRTLSLEMTLLFMMAEVHVQPHNRKHKFMMHPDSSIVAVVLCMGQTAENIVNNFNNNV